MRVDVGDLVGPLVATEPEAGSRHREHGRERAAGLGQGRADREARAARSDVFSRTSVARWILDAAAYFGSGCGGRMRGLGSAVDAMTVSRAACLRACGA